MPGKGGVAAAATLLVIGLGLAIPRVAAQDRTVTAAPEAAAASEESAATRQRHALRARENADLVGFIAGDIDSTDLHAASDLAEVLGVGRELRVLPMVGGDAFQNAKDIAVTRGIDLGIVQADVLEQLRRAPFFPGLDRYLQYVTRLYDEEVHILARQEIGDIADLAGKPVNVGPAGGGMAFTAAAIFGALHVTVSATHFDADLALEKLKAGEIAALVYIAGKPAPLFAALRGGDGLHFLPIAASGELARSYTPAALTPADYPELITAETRVDTVGVAAVLMAYNWPPGSERYRRVAHFVDALCDRLKELQQSPRHPKWHRLDLAAPVPGWTRFAPAEHRVHSAALAPPPADPAREPPEALFENFAAYLDRDRAVSGSSVPPGELDGAQREALFRDFDAWRRDARQPLEDPRRRESLFLEFVAWRKGASAAPLR